ncbi:MAG: YqgE/AlgH family protein [Candidatus Kapaibacteriota bacterium]
MTSDSGIVLLASQTLLDTNFKRTVVLLAQHTDDGALGYVLNRPLSATLAEVVPDLYGFDAPLYWGGPCQNDTLHCIHNVGTHIPGAAEITDGVYWGGDFDAIRNLIITGAASAENFRFFIGYAGWGIGQLEKEINEQSWLLTTPSQRIVFPDSVKNLWTRTVKGMGGEYNILANTPEHLSLN